MSNSVKSLQIARNAGFLFYTFIKFSQIAAKASESWIFKSCRFFRPDKSILFVVKNNRCRYGLFRYRYEIFLVVTTSHTCQLLTGFITVSDSTQNLKMQFSSTSAVKPAKSDSLQSGDDTIAMGSHQRMTSTKVEPTMSSYIKRSQCMGKIVFAILYL